MLSLLDTGQQIGIKTDVSSGDWAWTKALSVADGLDRGRARRVAVHRRRFTGAEPCRLPRLVRPVENQDGRRGEFRGAMGSDKTARPWAAGPADPRVSGALRCQSRRSGWRGTRRRKTRIL